MYSPFESIDLGVPISFEVIVTSGGLEAEGKESHKSIVPATVAVTADFVLVPWPARPHTLIFVVRVRDSSRFVVLRAFESLERHNRSAISIPDFG